MLVRRADHEQARPRSLRLDSRPRRSEQGPALDPPRPAREQNQSALGSSRQLVEVPVDDVRDVDEMVRPAGQVDFPARVDPDDDIGSFDSTPAESIANVGPRNAADAGLCRERVGAHAAVVKIMGSDGASIAATPYGTGSWACTRSASRRSTTRPTCRRSARSPFNNDHLPSDGISMSRRRSPSSTALSS